MAKSPLSYGAQARALAGTPKGEAHVVLRWDINKLCPELRALEDELIDTFLCPGLVSVHKEICAAMAGGTAPNLLQLRECSKADIYLHRSFLRALPRWHSRHGAEYPLSSRRLRAMLENERWGGLRVTAALVQPVTAGTPR